MKKFFLSLLTFCAFTASAQNEIVVGDMNDDGQLTVGDVTSLTETVIGKAPRRTISTKCDPNASDPSVIAGSWRATDNSTLELTAEGKATVSGNSAVTQFEYFPFRGDLVLLNAGGYVVQDYHVLRLAKDYLVFRLADGTYATYYPSDRYATGLTLSATSLSLKTGETQQLSVVANPDGSILGGLTWTSSNPEVASVDPSGFVTALKGDTTTITVTTESGETLSAQCSVDVTQLVTSISLSVTTLTLDIDGYTKLTATVLPADASDLSITWSSSDEDVAEVNSKGVVTVNGYGRCTITATANDGSGVKAECVIVVEKPHEYVDLGLPSGTLWATTNVGADTPEDYGYYFAWAEVEPKSIYNWNTYKWMKEGYSDWNGCNKYTIADGQTSGCWYNNGTFVGDNKTELDLEDDAAYMNWGEGWRMPSRAQQDELRDTNNCTWTWTNINGKNGYLVKSKRNDSSLFLPAAGISYEGSLYDARSDGYYWSRSLSASNSVDGYCLTFGSSSIDWYDYGRYNGRSVRPVRVSGSE